MGFLRAAFWLPGLLLGRPQKAPRAPYGPLGAFLRPPGAFLRPPGESPNGTSALPTLLLPFSHWRYCDVSEKEASEQRGMAFSVLPLSDSALPGLLLPFSHWRYCDFSEKQANELRGIAFSVLPLSDYPSLPTFRRSLLTTREYLVAIKQNKKGAPFVAPSPCNDPW